MLHGGGVQVNGHIDRDQHQPEQTEQIRDGENLFFQFFTNIASSGNFPLLWGPLYDKSEVLSRVLSMFFRFKKNLILPGLPQGLGV